MVYIKISNAWLDRGQGTQSQLHWESSGRMCTGVIRGWTNQQGARVRYAPATGRIEYMREMQEI